MGLPVSAPLPAASPRAVMEQATAEILARIRRTGWPDHPGEPVPWDINRGRCVEWAELVCDRVPTAVMAEWDDGDMLHTFVVLRGRNYDADCIDGAADVTELPCFTRPPKPRPRGRRAVRWVLGHGGEGL
jgi:hypothetical protein